MRSCVSACACECASVVACSSLWRGLSFRFVSPRVASCLFFFPLVLFRHVLCSSSRVSPRGSCSIAFIVLGVCIVHDVPWEDRTVGRPVWGLLGFFCGPGGELSPKYLLPLTFRACLPACRLPPVADIRDGRLAVAVHGSSRNRRRRRRRGRWWGWRSGSPVNQLRPRPVHEDSELGWACGGSAGTRPLQQVCTWYTVFVDFLPEHWLRSCPLRAGVFFCFVFSLAVFPPVKCFLP